MVRLLKQESHLTDKDLEYKGPEYMEDMIQRISDLQFILVEHYHKLPYEEVRVCKERIDIVDDLIRQCLRRKYLTTLKKEFAYQRI